MDPRQNPYAPGAGTPPPELAGRDGFIEQAAIMLDRIRGGLSDKSLLLVGLRGAGKTVLLNRIRLDAEGRGITCVRLEAPEDRSLPGLLAPALRATLLKLDRIEAIGSRTKRALRVLAGFIGATKVRFGDVVELGLDITPERGVADTGDLETDLSDLLAVVGEAAQERQTAVALFVDELQYIREDQLAALITALHHCAQQQLPVMFVGAGLPQLVGNVGKAKSYAERLFEFANIGQLDALAARQALMVPAERLHVQYDDTALSRIFEDTQGYPYFLQEWGKHAWIVAEASPISETDARTATVNALAELDGSFFRVRFDRLTPAEKRYLRAMAELGAGPHRSGDVAEVLKKPVSGVAPVRATLISKGMIYSPSHGETAFTVPLFDGFMKRIMPTL